MVGACLEPTQLLSATLTRMQSMYILPMVFSFFFSVCLRLFRVCVLLLLVVHSAILEVSVTTSMALITVLCCL